MHPGEAELLALIDGELDPDEAEAIRAHLAGCAACASRRADLEALLEENRAALAALESGVVPEATAEEIIARAERGRPATSMASRRPFLRGRFLRAASVALLVAAAGAAVALPGSPVREAALRWIEGRGPASEPAPEGAPPATGVAVQAAGRLVVAFAAGQAEGAIDIVLEPTDTARIEASDAAVSFSVASDSIAVENAGSKASYVLTLPEGLPRAEVRVGGVVVYRKVGGDIQTIGPVQDRRATIPFAAVD